MPQLILASQSEQRRIILKTTGLNFEIIPADINEQAISAQTEERRTAKIALAKAKKIATSHPNAIIIAADTYTVVNNKAYQKPTDQQEAITMLQEQSGQTGVCLTGFAYLDPSKEIAHSSTAVTKISFRELSDQEIQWYVAHNPVTTWSAAFCPAYPAGLALVATLDGSNTGFSHGLPMETLIPLLQKSNLV